MSRVLIVYLFIFFVLWCAIRFWSFKFFCTPLLLLPSFKFLSVRDRHSESVACPHGAQMANLFSPAWFRLFSQQKPRMLQMKSIHLFLSDLNRWSLIILHFLYLSSVIEPRTEIEERACSCVLPGWSVSNVPSKPITPKGKAERHFLSEMRDNGEEQTGTTGHVHHRGSVWHTAPRHCHRKQKASF